MMPQVQYFIPGSLEYTDKHIEVADGHHVAAKQRVQVQIKMFDNNGNPFVAELQNVLLTTDLCDRLFSIISLINFGMYLFISQGFCTVYFGDKEKNPVTLPHNAQRKHAFWGKIKSKSDKLAPRKKVYVGLFHQILGHRSTR